MDERSRPGDEKPRWRGSTMGGILGYLDMAEKNPPNRVMEILGLMLELQSPKRNESRSAITRKKEFLDQKLSKYRFVPDLLPSRTGGWAREWHVMPVGRRGSSSTETSVLQFVLAYAIAGKLARFRKCADCSKWMYAKFRHQTFCSAKCQQRHYRHSEKGKVKKRNYMREYRDRDRISVA